MITKEQKAKLIKLIVSKENVNSSYEYAVFWHAPHEILDEKLAARTKAHAILNDFIDEISEE